MSVVNRQLAPPIDWQSFERLMCDLFRAEWSDPHTQLNGRSGQPQAGVDVFGRPGGRLTGVQCKGRDSGYRSSLTADELREEAEKAKSFKPQLNVFILATSAPNDVKVQEAARVLSEEHRALGLFEVHIYGWDTLRQRLAQQTEVLRVHYSDLTGPDWAGEVGELLKVVRSQHEIHAKLLQSREVGGNDDPLRRSVEDAAQLCEQGAARAALFRIERIKAENWNTASASNQSRILATLGHCRLVLGETEQGIADLRTSFVTDPERSGAIANLAVAQLLSGQKAQAHETARKAFTSDSTCEQAAIVFAATAPQGMSFGELLSIVPEALRLKSGVVRSLCDAAWERQAFDQALLLAEGALAREPHNWRNLAQLGTQLLELALTDPALALTRRVDAERQSEFSRGTNLLRAAWQAVRNTDNVRIAGWVAANLTVALLTLGEEEDASHLVNEALKLAPGEPELLRRRAFLAANASDWSATRDAIRAMPSDTPTIDDRLLLCKASLELGELAEARNLMRDIAITTKAAGQLEERVAALELEIAIADGGGEAEIKEAFDAHPQSMLVISAAMPTVAGIVTFRSHLLEAAHAAGATGNARDKALAAEVLAMLEDYSAAADILSSVSVPFDRDTHISRLRLLSSPH